VASGNDLGGRVDYDIMHYSKRMKHRDAQAEFWSAMQSCYQDDIRMIKNNVGYLKAL